MPLDRVALDDVLGFRLRQAQHYILGQFKHRFEQFGIKPTEYSMLVLLRDNPGLMQSEVAEALGLKRANLVGMALHLTQRGLIERSVSDSDRRAERLTLTAAGLALLAEAAEVQRILEAECAERVGGEAERQQLVALLAKLAGTDPHAAEI